MRLFLSDPVKKNQAPARAYMDRSSGTPAIDGKFGSLPQKLSKIKSVELTEFRRHGFLKLWVRKVFHQEMRLT